MGRELEAVKLAANQPIVSQITQFPSEIVTVNTFRFSSYFLTQSNVGHVEREFLHHGYPPGTSIMSVSLEFHAMTK